MVSSSCKYALTATVYCYFWFFSNQCIFPELIWVELGLQWRTSWCCWTSCTWGLVSIGMGSRLHAWKLYQSRLISDCSVSSLSLTVGHTRLSTVGDRAFLVAAACIWNSLPQHITPAPSMIVVQSLLKTQIFTILYPSPLPHTVPAQWHLSFWTL